MPSDTLFPSLRGAVQGGANVATLQLVEHLREEAARAAFQRRQQETIRQEGVAGQRSSQAALENLLNEIASFGGDVAGIEDAGAARARVSELVRSERTRGEEREAAEASQGIQDTLASLVVENPELTPILSGMGVGVADVDTREELLDVQGRLAQVNLEAKQQKAKDAAIQFGIENSFTTQQLVDSFRGLQFDEADLSLLSSAVGNKNREDLRGQFTRQVNSLHSKLVDMHQGGTPVDASTVLAVAPPGMDISLGQAEALSNQVNQIPREQRTFSPDDIQQSIGQTQTALSMGRDLAFVTPEDQKRLNDQQQIKKQVRGTLRASDQATWDQQVATGNIPLPDPQAQQQAQVTFEQMAMVGDRESLMREQQDAIQNPDNYADYGIDPAWVIAVINSILLEPSVRPGASAEFGLPTGGGRFRGAGASVE